MADKRIQDLTPATSVQTNDLFVLEQSGAAKSLTGQILINDLATALDGHGGISDITYTAPVSPSLNGTLTITMADNTAYTVTVTNGNGIASIAIAYGVSNQGTDPSYITSWSSSPVAPTNTNPYAWTRIRMTDKTGTATDAYGISMKATDPTVTVGTVTATSGASAGATVTNSGTAYAPTLDFGFTLPKGDKGDTGDYIEPVVSYGTSTAAATEPSTWYNSPTSISYAAGNFIWRKTEYTLHDAGTVQSTETEIIGYIGQNGSGSGTVQQITFNGTVYADDGTGNVDMSVDAEEVGAIADPSTKSNGQVLTYDSTAGAWVAANPSTGNVNTVNSKGVDAGTTNITIYGTDIKMSSSDNTTVQAAIPTAPTTTPANLGTAAIGSSGAFARADHVHAMPTAANVGAMTYYNSVADLGLTVGSATIAGAYAAMAADSILVCNAADFDASEVPSIYGTVEIINLTNYHERAIINFRAKASSTATKNNAFMFLDGATGVPDGTWWTVPAPSSSTPADLGTASAGTSLYYSRADHVHNLAVMDCNGISALATASPYNATGTISEDIKYKISGNYMLVMGRARIAISSRTGANPGVRYAIPDNKKIDGSFVCNLSPSSYSDSPRNGEATIIEGIDGEGYLQVKGTESYNNVVTNKTLVMYVPPTVIKIK